MTKLGEIIKAIKEKIETEILELNYVGFFPNKENIIGDRLPSVLVGISNDTANETTGIRDEIIVNQTLSVFVYSNRFQVEGIFATTDLIDRVKKAVYVCLDEIQLTCLISHYDSLDIDFGTKLDEFDKEIAGWFGDISTVKITVTLTYRDSRSL